MSIRFTILSVALGIMLSACEQKPAATATAAPIPNKDAMQPAQQTSIASAPSVQTPDKRPAAAKTVVSKNEKKSTVVVAQAPTQIADNNQEPASTTPPKSRRQKAEEEMMMEIANHK